MSELAEWHSRFGGIEWRVTAHGVETRAGGLMRTPGAPVTIRRMLDAWGDDLRMAEQSAGVPLAILLMTVATEAGARWVDGAWAYPAVRIEPGYASDEATPGRISFGPCHTTLESFRAVMKLPNATRAQAAHRASNMLAAARYIRDRRPLHNLDPILVAASYNAGGLYAARPGSAYHNRWHLRSWGTHLDRAARWYGDACAVLAERAPLPTLHPKGIR